MNSFTTVHEFYLSSDKRIFLSTLFHYGTSFAINILHIKELTGHSVLFACEDCVKLTIFFNFRMGEVNIVIFIVISAVLLINGGRYLQLTLLTVHHVLFACPLLCIVTCNTFITSY